MSKMMIDLGQTWSVEDTIFVVTLSISALFTLYAIMLIHRRMRVIENELQAIRKDQTVMSEELELVATMKRSKA